jgi:hypothetical protein
MPHLHKALLVIRNSMRRLLFISSLLLLISYTSISQNIFDTSTVNNSNDSSEQKPYFPTKFEQYIKAEVQKKLNSETKIVLLTLKGNLLFHYDSTIHSFVYNKYILLQKQKGKPWLANSYLEVPPKEGYRESVFMKSKEVNISENIKLTNLQKKWDSLEFDIYLPFVSVVKRNGKIGHSPEEYMPDRQVIYFYAIDKFNRVFRELYKFNTFKKLSWHHFTEYNSNYDFNYSQPSFAAIIYALTLYESNTLFSDYTIQ